MKHKKIVSLLLAGVLTLSLAACGKDAPEAEKEETAEVVETLENEETGSTEQKGGYSEDEQVEVTFWSAGPTEEGVLSDAVSTEIARITGVKIKNVTGDDDKFQVLLAAGDLPDVVYCNGTGAQSPSSLISSGQIIPLDELVDEHCENVKQWGEQALSYSRTVLSDESQALYFVPMNVSNNQDTAAIPSFFGCGITFTMRWDLYAQAGYPEITDEDSYLEVLKQMQEQFGKTADGKTIYAMGAWADWGTWAFRIPYTFANGLGEGKNATVYDQMSGKIEPMYYSDAYWNAVRFYNKAYNMGLLDPESFTQSYDDYVAKAKAGQYIALGINGTGAVSGINDALQAVDPSSGYEYVPCGMSYLAGLYTSSAPYGWGSGNFAFAVSTNNEHVEETMRLLNFLYSPEGSRLLLCGIEGEDWEYTADGDVAYTEQYQEGLVSDPENYKKNRGIGIYTYLNGIGGTQILEDGTPVNVANTVGNIASSLTQCDQDYCSYYSELYGKEITYPGEAVAELLNKGYDFSFEYTGLVNELTSAGTDDITSILSEIDAMVSTDFINLIMLPEGELEDALKNEIAKIDAAGYADMQETIKGLTEVAEERASNIE